MFQFFDNEGIGCTQEWLDQYEHLGENIVFNKIEEVFSTSDANAGRGWNQTRRLIVDTTLAQLQKVYDGHIA